MPIIATLTLPNPGPVISTFVRIQYEEREYGYEIESIEMYADAACKQLLGDFTLDELPATTQDIVCSAVDNQRYREARARGLLRLKADLEADLYAKRLLDGARA
jgi:hypothetical protein